MPILVRAGDSLEVLREYPDAHFHAVVTDPPYGLSKPLSGAGAAEVLSAWLAEGIHTPRRKTATGFMGKAWDGFVPSPRLWSEVLRVTRPGGHALVFSGTRTAGWMAISLMLAGWEVIDQINWIYAEGFPKGGNVGRRVNDLGVQVEGAQWDDWSTTLKPAHEPIIVARRPLGESSVAVNLLKWRTGALNIGACRIPTAEDCARKPAIVGDTAAPFGRGVVMGGRGSDAGRWPANVFLTHSEACDEDACAHGCPVRVLDGQGSGASRFFFNAKANSADRSEGLPEGGKADHPTIKPTPLMRELVRLVCTPGTAGEPPGLVLDPFGGSGSTGVALALEGLRGVLIERDEHYMHDLATPRIRRAIEVATCGDIPKHWRRRGAL